MCRKEKLSSCSCRCCQQPCLIRLGVGGITLIVVILDIGLVAGLGVHGIELQTPISHDVLECSFLPRHFLQ